MGMLVRRRTSLVRAYVSDSTCVRILPTQTRFPFLEIRQMALNINILSLGVQTGQASCVLPQREGGYAAASSTFSAQEKYESVKLDRTRTVHMPQETTP